jgi:hypothetical protein
MIGRQLPLFSVTETWVDTSQYACFIFGRLVFWTFDNGTAFVPRLHVNVVSNQSSRIVPEFTGDSVSSGPDVF